MNKMQEYDKRMGVPEFEGWQEREIEHYRQETKQSNTFIYLNIEKPSQKSRVLFVRIGKRRFELEINWCVNTISLSTGLKGSYSRKIF